MTIYTVSGGPLPSLLHCCYHGLHQWYRGCASLRYIYGDRGLPIRGSPSCQALSYLPEFWGTPLGKHPNLLLPGALALGNLQMRLTQKHPQGPTILLLRGVGFFYIAWNYGCGATGVLWVGRVHFFEWPPFGRNEPLPTLGILSFTLCTVSWSGWIGQLIHRCGSGGNWIFQSSRASTLGSW